MTGGKEYIFDVSKSACEDVHKTGILKVSDAHIVHGIIVNQTVTHSIILTEYLNGEGKCDGAGYSDPFETWKNVVVQSIIKITLTEQEARINLQSNAIHLRSGTVCSLSEGNCIDQEGGYTFWNSILIDNCQFHQCSILFKGLANKMVDFDFNNDQIMYSLATQDITFALAAKGRESVCGYTLIKIKHPKLVIFETV